MRIFQDYEIGKRRLKTSHPAEEFNKLKTAQAQAL